MARQDCLLTYSGKLDRKIGYKTKKGHFVRSLPEQVRQTYATRQAAYRFGRASSMAAFIRKSLCAIADIHKDEGYINRLTKRLIPSAGRDLSSIAGYRFHKAKGITASYKDGILHIPPQKEKCINIITLCIDVNAKIVRHQSISTITLDPGTSADIPVQLPEAGTWIIALQSNQHTEIITVLETAVIQPPIIYPLPQNTYIKSSTPLHILFIQKE